MTRQPAPPDWIEPELATLTRDRFSGPGWMFERKLDGERCLAFQRGGRVSLLTRNKKSANAAYPEIVEALAAQRAGDFVADGEVVSFDGDRTSFARLQQRIHVGRPSAELRARIPVCYYLFDIVWADGADLRPRPLRDRKERLRGHFSWDDPLRFTPHRNTDGEAYFKEACEKGWEGLIAKRAGAPYRGGRTQDWLKFKCESGQEFVIGGYTDPQRSRVGFGALLLGYYDSEGRLAYAGKVGTGFSQRMLLDLHAELAGMERPHPPFALGHLPRSGVHWVEPKLVGQIGFSEWTRDGQLRQPRFQGLRRDKPPTDVVREMPAKPLWPGRPGPPPGQGAASLSRCQLCRSTAFGRWGPGELNAFANTGLATPLKGPQHGRQHRRRVRRTRRRREGRHRLHREMPAAPVLGPA